MTLPFSVHDGAEPELNEAADFYDLERTVVITGRV